MTYPEQDARIRQGWEARRGAPCVHAEVEPPVFAGHPRFSREFSYQIAIFVLRVFHNRETEFYDDANRALIENSRFYIENTDVRDDRDSFYWNIGELCRAVLRYGTLGTEEPGLITKEAEDVFLEMALGYCHDMSRLTDAAAGGVETWHIYESENHHVQRDSALWQLLLILIRHGRGAEVMGDGATAETHFAAWTRFFKNWMRERAGRSMFVEVHSKCYGTHTMKNLMPLIDFSPDEELRRMTVDFFHLYWALWAEEQIGGTVGGGMTRVYPGSAERTDSEAAHWAWYYTGVASFRAPSGSDYVLLDCGYRMPEMLVQMILHPEKRGVYTTESRPLGKASPKNHFPDYYVETEWGGIYRTSYVTPHLILGTLQCPQLLSGGWVGISGQNRFQGATLSVPNAQILPLPAPTGLHGLHSTKPINSFNAFWSMMAEGTLLTQRCGSYKGGMRVWFSDAGGVSEITERDGWLFTGCAGAFAAVRILRGGYHWEPSDHRITGRWLICEDPATPVILEAGDLSRFPTADAFADAVCALAPTEADGVLRYRSLYGHDFVMYTACDGASTVDGEYYAKQIPWSFRSPFVNAPWKSAVVTLSFLGETMTLDFSAGDFPADDPA